MDKRDSLKLGYSLVANTLPETDGYHAVVSHAGSVDKDTFCSRVAARRPGLEASTAELVLSSVCSTAAEFLAERQYRVSLSDVTFELAVPGSTDSVDGELEGPAYVAVRPSKSLRNAASGITPVYSGIEGDRTDIFTVEDFATRASNTIIGTDSFRVVGVNLSATGDGESVKVTASDGTEAVAEVVDEDGAGRHITARLAEPLRPGKGKVTLTTHGWRTPEGELRTLVKSVTIFAGDPEPVDPPVATGYVADEMEGEPINMDGSSLVVSGTNLTGATKVRFSYAADGETFYEMPVSEATAESASGTCGYTGTLTANNGYLRVVTPGGVSNALPCAFNA